MSAAKVDKLICTDLDGTLLASNGTISDENVEAFRACKNCNVVVAPVTGRGPYGLLHAAGTAKLARMEFSSLAPGVYLNGGLVLGTYGNVLSRAPMSQALVEEFVTFCAAANLANNLVGYTQEQMECLELNQNTLKSHAQYNEPKPVQVPALDKDYFKICVTFSDRDSFSTARQQLETQFKARLKFCEALDLILEAMPYANSKGAGIRILAASLSVHRENIIGIGDSENDLPMLEYVGVPVAVQNASDLVKSVAKHVVPSNDEHGFAVACAKFANVVIK